LPILLLLLAAMSWLARDALHQRIRTPDGAGWVTSDRDSLYHMRRVERLFREGGPVAERDSYLDFPHGSPIPWPPYYTWLVAGAVGPFLPEDPEARRGWIERRVASIPLIFGVGTTLLAALAARALAGTAGAWIAGAYHAFNMASIPYSRSGNGDHHAWITLLSGALLLFASRALRSEALERRSAGLGWGAALGLVAGLAVGSWTASLLSIMPFQLVLGWLILLHARRPRPGLPGLGLGFHLVAAGVLLPAVLTSPWPEVNPWMVVNLSWFHPAFLLLGAATFVPLLFLRPGTRALRSYPWSVALFLIALGLFLAGSDTGPARGIREGFEWLGRSDEFMSSVWESRPLVGKNAVHALPEVLGYGILLLPFSWVAAAHRAFRRDRLDLLPWVISLPFLFLEMARQYRFADALALPMAVLLGWGCVEAWNSSRGRVLVRSLPGIRKLPEWGAYGILLSLVLLAQPEASAPLLRRAATGIPETGQVEQRSALAVRGMCEWIRRHTPPSNDYSVLASWNWGHLIEWAADRPTIATNFGPYVGEEGFRHPDRFFMCEDPAEAEELLRTRRARYVLSTADIAGDLRRMIRRAVPHLERRYTDPSPLGDVKVRAEWFRTMGARLMFDGLTLSPDAGYAPVGAPFDFLRLVHVSPLRDDRYRLQGRSTPYGWVWERVRGAVLEASGDPGTELRVRIEVGYAAGRHELVWTRTAVADAEGMARIRVPYATESPNGDGVAAGPARWRFGGREGTIAIPERAVIEGEVFRIGRSPGGTER
jgi:asparagine N-glycosylation enzyme membrane subunit Stt3